MGSLETFLAEIAGGPAEVGANLGCAGPPSSWTSLSASFPAQLALARASATDEVPVTEHRSSWLAADGGRPLGWGGADLAHTPWSWGALRSLDQTRPVPRFPL